MCSPKQTAYLQTRERKQRVKKMIGNQEEIELKLFNCIPQRKIVNLKGLLIHIYYVPEANLCKKFLQL